MVLVLLAVGLAIGFAAARRAPAQAVRRRAGVAILVALALVPVAVDRRAGALRARPRRLDLPRLDGADRPRRQDAANDPGRLTAVGSVRARYWDEAIQIFEARPLAGVGAGGYATARPRYRDDALDVAPRPRLRGADARRPRPARPGRQPRAAWPPGWWPLRTGHRAAPRRRPRPATAPERIGLLTLVAVVVVFGVHSLVDWTWFVPGNAVDRAAVRRLAGRARSVAEAPGAATRLRDRLREGVRDRRRAAAAGGCRRGRVAAAWATWQPLRSVRTGNDALAASRRGELDEARGMASRRGDRNPLSIEPLFDLAPVEIAAGRKDAARAAFEDAVQLQPASPRPWLRLAEFELGVADDAPGRPRGGARRAVPRPALVRRDSRSSSTRAGAPRPRADRNSVTPGVCNGDDASMPRRTARLRAASRFCPPAAQRRADPGVDVPGRQPAGLRRAAAAPRARSTRCRRWASTASASRSSGGSSRPPPTAAPSRDFDAADPDAYPRARGTATTRSSGCRRDAGSAVNFNLTAPAPNWATGKPGAPDIDETFDPNADEFGLFVRALGTPLQRRATSRAEGRHRAAARRLLVDLERAQPGRLADAAVGRRPARTRGGSSRPRRRSTATSSTAPGPRCRRPVTASDTILIGETAPKGRSDRGETRVDRRRCASSASSTASTTTCSSCRARRPTAARLPGRRRRRRQVRRAAPRAVPGRPATRTTPTS